MKVFAISDLHLSSACNKPMDVFGGAWQGYWEKIKSDWNQKVSDDDVVLIAGDISWAMNMSEAVPDLQDIASLKGIKVILKGNHDYWWSTLSKVKAVLPKGMIAIQNNCERIGNLLLCGSRLWSLNITNDEDKKILDRETIRLEMSLKKMQEMRTDKDYVIAMTHYPPYDAMLNDSEFTKLFEQYNVNDVVYGHLHGKDCRAVLQAKKKSIKYWLTSCDQINNKLVLIKEL